MSSGSRLLMVHSPGDLSATWQERTTKGGRETFGLGVNLFVWAAGKGTFRNRLDTPYIPDPPDARTPPVPVVRLSYVGGWDPEPYAWTRFDRYLRWTAGVPLPLTLTAAAVADLRPGQAALAVLSGSAAAAFTDADAAAVRGYVTAGGTLLVDACGGSPAFADSARSLLGKAFPGVEPKPLAGDDPLARGGRPGLDDLSHPLLRPFAAERLNLGVGRPAPPLLGLTAGAGRVVFSPLDLTTGLLGTDAWGIDGYAPAYAQAVVKNVMLIAGGAK